MDSNSYLVFWLLGAPLLLALVDRMTMGGSSAGAARSSGFSNGRAAAAA